MYVCACFQNYFENIPCPVFNDNGHPSASIVGRLNLQAPSIVLVAAGRVRHGFRITCLDKADEYKVVRTFEFLIAFVAGDQYVMDV